MSAVVSLRIVADEFDACLEEWGVYLNRRTGKCVTISDEDMAAAEDGDKADESGMADWERETAAEAREVAGSDDWIALPERRDWDEYEVMREFAEETPGATGERLQEAIGGKGAFRRFKEAVLRAGIEKQWYGLREKRIKEFVVAWLDETGIEYLE